MESVNKLWYTQKISLMALYIVKLCKYWYAKVFHTKFNQNMNNGL